MASTPSKHLNVLDIFYLNVAQQSTSRPNILESAQTSVLDVNMSIL